DTALCPTRRRIDPSAGKHVASGARPRVATRPIRPIGLALGLALGLDRLERRQECACAIRVIGYGRACRATSCPVSRVYPGMREDSPPPFIVTRTPAPPKLDVYDRALELVGLVQKLLDTTTARFHLKDRLDRLATTLVFELSRARHAVRAVRW